MTISAQKLQGKQASALILASLGLAGLSHASTLRGTVSGTTGSVTSALSRATVCLADDTTSCWLTRSNGTFALSFDPVIAKPVDLSRSTNTTAHLAEGSLILPVAAPGLYRLEAVNSSGRVLESRPLSLPAGVQRVSLGSETLDASGIAFVRVSGPGGTWTARLVRGKGSIHAEAGNASLPVVAGRSAASSAVIVSAPGFVSQTVSIPTDSTKWGSLAVTLVRAPLQTVSFSAYPGPFWSPISLTLSTSVINGIIRYTTDGTVPTNLSNVYYNIPFEISSDTLFRAQVYKSGVAQGTVQDLAYWKQTLALDKVSGAYPGFVHVTATSLNGDERYSLDGSVPTANSPLWDGKLGLDITKDAFLVLRTFQAHRVPTAAEYSITDVTDSSLMPAFSAPTRFYDTALVTLVAPAKWPDAEIHYTTDGTTPTMSSPLYTAPFGVWKTCSVRAIAHSTGYVSPVVTNPLSLVTPTQAPVFDTTVKASFTDSVKVAMFAASGMVIRYTVDGTTPTQVSPVYTGAFWLKNTATVKAFCGTRNPSAVVSRTYSLDGTPRIAPDSGLLANQTSVTVTIASTSSVIRYTLDGTDPTTLSAVYPGPLTLTTFPVTVKARVFWPQVAPSAVSSVTYTQTADGIVIPKATNPFVPQFPEVGGILGTMTDSRDGKVYKTTQIGSQVWLAQNLDYASVGLCYNYSADSCAKYGRLYTWAEVMNGSSSSSSSPIGVQGLCPTGWHVPSDAEWSLLQNSTGVSGVTDGAKLKSTSGWNDYSRTSGNGTDQYGFRALPAGGIYTSGFSHDIGYTGSWWSATEYDSTNAVNIGMSYMSANAGRTWNHKANWFSLRCVKD